LIRPGRELRLSATAADVHLFDPATGLRLAEAPT
jgi:hypothetical protein